MSVAKAQWTYTVDHEMHDGLGHEVSDGFVDDADVRIDQVADGFHLSLQLRVHGERVCGGSLFILRLTRTTHTDNKDALTEKYRGACVNEQANINVGIMASEETQSSIHIPDPSLDKLLP